MELRATVRRPLAAAPSIDRVRGILPAAVRPNGGSNGVMPDIPPAAAAAAAGAGAGGLLMYLLDPVRGRRRRARVRDKAVRYAHETADETSRAAHDARNRGKGLAARAGSAVRPRAVTTDRLEERVRARLARKARHVGAVDVHVEGDRVTLSGPVLRAEVDAVREAARSVRGVGMVEDRLEVHEDLSGSPGFENIGKPTVGPVPEAVPPRWPVAVRVVAGATGAGLVAYGVGRRDRLGAAAGGAGVVLAGVAATNLGAARRDRD